MLWIAGLLAILAGMPQLGFAIFVVTLLNGLFAFFQEYRAEHTSERLRDLLPRRATVLRDGFPVEVNASELVSNFSVILPYGYVALVHPLLKHRRCSQRVRSQYEYSSSRKSG